MSKEAMQLALGVFSVIATADNLDWIRHQAEQQAAALREALAEQPAPLQRTWIGLTDEEIKESWPCELGPTAIKFARILENKMKDKNT